MTLADIRHRTPPRERRTVLTGGCGFLGTNLAHRLARDGRRVCLLDNLSRPGVEENLEWLRRTHGDAVGFQLADIRDRWAVEKAVGSAEAVFHLAAQVAVDSSVADPVQDFEINAMGTLNVLEGLRRLDAPPPLVFLSTHRVYGDLAELALELCDGRYRPAGGAWPHGIGEEARLDFRSPYGCSKGAADQYVRDYARNFGLPAVVFRPGCVYGPHQRGSEEEGWVAHFTRAALAGAPITLDGDGHQVRDVLWVDDLVEAMLSAERHAHELAGQAFNLGGGPANAVSPLDVLDRLGELLGAPPEVAAGDPRPGDPRYFVADTRRFQAATGWRPEVGVAEGLARLYDWMGGERASAAGRRAS